MKGVEPFRVEAQAWVPVPFMLRAMRFMLERGAAGLLLDPG